MSVDIQMEFAVEMSCKSCTDAVQKVLSENSVNVVAINLEKQQVLVKTNKAFHVVQDLIETTGKRAALVGYGMNVDGKHLGAAVAEISGPNSKGIIRMLQLDKNQCLIEGTVDGLSPGSHGFNIHEFGDISNGCASCGDHFNPFQRRHGKRDETERHVGDLGNIKAQNNGRSVFRFLDTQVKIWDIIGRSMVIHERPDDLGQSENVSSTKDGNSGAGIACGIIARSAGLLQNQKRVCACDGVVIWDERNVPAAGEERKMFSQKL